ncbi:MAG: LLM class flavin-dependent oxidoreductase [Chloroflexota bacterium]|nr:LLM class flavin-dependent oxidoreductase [Chloroflexota bacterium]
MQIGLMMRSGDNGGTGAHAPTAHRWTELRDMALLAEEVGVDTLGVPDHLLFRHAPPTVSLPDGETRGVWECFTLLAAFAAITRRVTLLPLVACTSFRNPALLAKIADSLDEVSGGRVLLGLGAGWHEPEYAAYGYPFDRRVSRFEEALQIIVPMLKGEPVTLRGRYYSVADSVLAPRGPRAGGPPIWIGARMPRMLGLVARYADAFHTDMLLNVDDASAAEALIAIADSACQTAGRDPATLKRTSGCSLGLQGFEDVPAGPPSVILHGSNVEIIDKLAAYAAIGIEHFTFWLHPWTMRSIERLAPIVEAAHAMQDTPTSLV